MEIVCRPETYRRFKSSSLRQTKNTPSGVFFRLVRKVRYRGFEGADVLREQNNLPYISTENYHQPNNSYKFRNNKDMYYNYHARNLQRIQNGELIGIAPSENPEYAFILVFRTYPFARPIRPHATWRYEQFIQ